VPRGQGGAVIHEPGEVVERAIRMARGGAVDTICLHSDTPGAVDLAARIRTALTEAGVSVRAVGSP
jgi:UPF0271 protein